MSYSMNRWIRQINIYVLVGFFFFLFLVCRFTLVKKKKPCVRLTYSRTMSMQIRDPPQSY